MNTIVKVRTPYINEKRCTSNPCTNCLTYISQAYQFNKDIEYITNVMHKTPRTHTKHKCQCHSLYCTTMDTNAFEPHPEDAQEVRDCRFCAQDHMAKITGEMAHRFDPKDTHTMMNINLELTKLWAQGDCDRIRCKNYVIYLDTPIHFKHFFKIFKEDLKEFTVRNTETHKYCVTRLKKNIRTSSLEKDRRRITTPPRHARLITPSGYTTIDLAYQVRQDDDYLYGPYKTQIYPRLREDGVILRREYRFAADGGDIPDINPPQEEQTWERQLRQQRRQRRQEPTATQPPTYAEVTRNPPPYTARPQESPPDRRQAETPPPDYKEETCSPT